MAWGQKLIVNRTGCDLTVTFRIRLEADPRHTAGTKTIDLSNGGSEKITYGNDQNPFLNGIELIAIRSGSMIARQDIVIDRGSDVDNELNINDTITISLSGTNFIVGGSNTWTVPATPPNRPWGQ